MWANFNIHTRMVEKIKVRWLTWEDIVVSILVSVTGKCCSHGTELFLSGQSELLKLPIES